MTFGARACVRLGAIRENLRIIKDKAPGTRVMAVVKANAYGHGLVPVSQALSEVDCLGVARLAEAKALREAGIDTPVAMLGGVFSADEMPEAIDLGVEIAVHAEEQIDWLQGYPDAGLVVWLKFDTGMNRLGFRPEKAEALISRLGNLDAVSELRLMTHFASADLLVDDTTTKQIERFRQITDGFDGAISIANSPGVLGWPDSLQNFSEFRDDGRLWVRTGLALYGLSPFPGQPGADLGLIPAMEFESQLIAVKQIRAGERVGYGGTWQASSDSMMGLVAVGYGDGYTRFIPSGTPVLVNGRRVPVVGRISMDICTVDLGSDASDRVGDRVLLWGKDLPVEEIAEHAGTIAYELVTGVTHREESVFEE